MMMNSFFRDNFTDSFFNDFRPVHKARTPQFGLMRTDIKEKEEGFELMIDLPGYEKDNITAELKDGYMKVTASVNHESEEKAEDGRYIRRERFNGERSRLFYVGENVTEEDIKASFTDGVLNIFIPKKEAAAIEEKKYIAIA